MHKIGSTSLVLSAIAYGASAIGGNSGLTVQV